MALYSPPANLSSPATRSGTLVRVGHATLWMGWNDERLSASLGKALSYFGFEPEQGKAHDACVLTLAQHVPSLAVPPEAVLLSESPEGLRFYRAGNTLWIAFRATVVHLDLESAEGRCTLDPAFDAMSDTLQEALLFGIVFYSTVLLLSTRGLHTTHAACLVHEGAGYLFAGHSDSGKSTLTMRLVEQGWHYLTDDSVLIDAHDGQVTARPLRHDFCLDPDAAAMFPQVAACWEPHMGDVRKQRLRIRELYPDGYAPHCTPRVLVFPQIVAASTSRLVPLDGKTALLRLIQHSGTLTLLDTPAAAAHLAALQALVLQVKSVILLAGRDLLDDPLAAARLFQHASA